MIFRCCRSHFQFKNEKKTSLLRKIKKAWKFKLRAADNDLPGLYDDSDKIAKGKSKLSKCDHVYLMSKWQIAKKKHTLNKSQTQKSKKMVKDSDDDISMVTKHQDFLTSLEPAQQ